MVVYAEDQDLAIGFRNLRRLALVESPVQRIELFKHPQLGKILKIDGEIQHVERWQPLYHEPIVHLPAAFVPEIRNVLILGGGSLFAAFEALRYPTVRRCTLVDHDAAVIELMVQHYPHAATVAKDPRFSHVQANAMGFLRSACETYDLIINDCFDSLQTGPKGISAFPLMSDRLTADGVCSDLIYRHAFERSHFARTQSALRRKHHAFSLVTVPEYPGILHVMVCWGSRRVSQQLRAPINRWQRSWRRKKPALEYYDPRFLPYYLYVPPYLR